jgi:uncharacterized membrane protein
VKLTNIDKAFELWRDEGQLDDAQIEALRRTLEDAQSKQRSSRAVVLFSSLGAVLVGLGVILFVASHWDSMGPLTRSLVLIATYLVSVAAAYATQKRGFSLLSESLWFLATLVLGADIFLIGQLFNFTLTFWQGPFLWCIGAVSMGLARGKAAYGWLALPLGLLALGWLGGGSGWLFDEQFEFLTSEQGLLPLLPAIGIALFCLGAPAGRSEHWAFVRPACVAWGLGLISIPLIVGTADDDVVGEIFRAAFTSKQIVILSASVLAVLLFAIRGRASKQSVSAVVFLLLVSVALLAPREGESAIGILVHEYGVFFLLYILLVFAISIGAIWIGLNERSTGLIHLGLASASILIFIQYFSWSFELLDRSIAFIAGGLVLLGAGYGLERARQHLLARMEAA